MGLGAPFADPRGLPIDKISQKTGVKIQTLTTWADDLTERICLKASEEASKILYDTENYICLVNILISLIAVKMSFGNLKTVQKGYNKFLENFPAAMDYVDRIGAKAAYDEIVNEMGINELEFVDCDINLLFDPVKQKENMVKYVFEKYGKT